MSKIYHWRRGNESSKKTSFVELTSDAFGFGEVSFTESVMGRRRNDVTLEIGNSTMGVVSRTCSSSLSLLCLWGRDEYPKCGVHCHDPSN